MGCKILDTNNFTIIYIGGYFSYVNHTLRLLTSGWGTYEAAIRNSNSYRYDNGTIQLMRKRYDENF